MICLCDAGVYRSPECAAKRDHGAYWIKQGQEVDDLLRLIITNCQQKTLIFVTSIFDLEQNRIAVSMSASPKKLVVLIGFFTLFLI
jgi:hypothetical protein